MGNNGIVNFIDSLKLEHDPGLRYGVLPYRGFWNRPSDESGTTKLKSLLIATHASPAFEPPVFQNLFGGHVQPVLIDGQSNHSAPCNSLRTFGIGPPGSNENEAGDLLTVPEFSPVECSANDCENFNPGRLKTAQM
jgi:hypothetical protein